ncbi:MAG: threonine-phosphate decarboxylase [Shewanella sp.]
MAIKHGGDLIQIATQYGSDVSEWIDLSTGVSPFTYPVGNVPEAVWNQLPQMNDGLESAAQEYYHAPTEPNTVAGSQAAIMALPALLCHRFGGCGVVALPSVGYKEHEYAWCGFKKNQLNWEILFYDDEPSTELVNRCDVVIVINPNNPTGKCLEPVIILGIKDQLALRGGMLIVDEAFIDVTPANSVLTWVSNFENLIVLRSVGKFFGLAGARVGFVFADPKIKALLQEHIGPWTVAGAGRWVMKQAFSDLHWQQQTRKRIINASDKLNQLLNRYLDCPQAGTHLFTTVYLPDAVQSHDKLCKQQVLTRLCDEKNAIRFGLPANKFQWVKLECALKHISEKREVQYEH